MTFSWPKTSISEQKFLLETSLVSSYFTSHPITVTVLFEIFGDACMGRPPPQILGGRLPSLPKSPFVFLASIGTSMSSLPPGACIRSIQQLGLWQVVRHFRWQVHAQLTTTTCSAFLIALRLLLAFSGGDELHTVRRQQVCRNLIFSLRSWLRTTTQRRQLPTKRRKDRLIAQASTSATHDLSLETIQWVLH